MPNRRRFLQSVSTLPLMGSASAARPSARDYIQELRVRTFINAAGTYTALTASLMAPEVMQAIESTSKKFVPLNDLHDAVGKRIASLIGCEGAMVTAGAASALTLGAAACITGRKADSIRQLPDTTGLKNQAIMQRSHRYGYDHAVRNCGLRIVEVETPDELQRAAGSQTAVMLFFNANEPLGKISALEFAALGKKLGVPTFNDAAADVPPVENLSKFTKMGFDLVTFSGGKGLRGPQSAGLLLGRKDLIEAARLNDSPNGDTIGRGMKVNKEEMVGMLAAVERYLALDHAAEWRDWERQCKSIADAVAPVSRAIQTEVFVPPIANAVPHLRIRWDAAALKITPAEVTKQLQDGDPSIELRPGAQDSIEVAVWMLQPGEAGIVARRIREVLKSASPAHS